MAAVAGIELINNKQESSLRREMNCGEILVASGLKRTCAVICLCSYIVSMSRVGSNALHR